ncbi:MAG: hypothetical protein E7465_06140 [Ruminococcaceae bacterium]|nr:hypothetical protein [Oscillospiraceae bacterium]
MNWRLILLSLVALGLLVLAIATWGSVGSAVCILCLMSMGSALLVKKFLINRDDSPFDSE